MLHPVATITNFIKERPIESRFFKYINLIPLVGSVVHIAKLHFLRDEMCRLLGQVDPDFQNAQSYLAARAKLNDIESMSQPQWQAVDSVLLLQGLSRPKSLYTYASIASGILLLVSRWLVSDKIASSARASFNLKREELVKLTKDSECVS